MQSSPWDKAVKIGAGISLFLTLSASVGSYAVSTDKINRCSSSISSIQDKQSQLEKAQTRNDTLQEETQKRIGELKEDVSSMRQEILTELRELRQRK